MSQVQKFQFGLMDLRVVELEGQPWFLVSDVCRALGYAVSGSTVNVTAAVKPLHADEVQRVPRSTFTLAKGGTTIPIVNESGLYKLIMRSDLPEAKAFQDWVTRVVLPAIRKDGAYILGEEKVVTGELDEDELVLKALGILQRKTERLTLERDRIAEQNRILECEKNHLAQQNQRILPAAQVGQAVAKRKSLGVVDFCRKLPGVSVNAVQTRLYDMQYFHKKHGHWSVYAKFKGVLFDESFSNEGYSKVIVLEAGQRKLVEMYHAGLLPMLKGRTPIKHLELDA